MPEPFNSPVESVRRVVLHFPTAGHDGRPVTEFFEAWDAFRVELAARGCPDTARASYGMLVDRPSLIVQWDAADDVKVPTLKPDPDAAAPTFEPAGNGMGHWDGSPCIDGVPCPPLPKGGDDEPMRPSRIRWTYPLAFASVVKWLNAHGQRAFVAGREQIVFGPPNGPLRIAIVGDALSWDGTQVYVGTEPPAGRSVTVNVSMDGKDIAKKVRRLAFFRSRTNLDPEDSPFLIE